MTGFTLPIQTQLRIVEELTASAEKAVRNAPEGVLVIGNKGTTTEWYHKKGRVRNYLPKTQRPLVHALAEPYERLSAPRKRLVEAYVLPDEEFARAWEQEAYEGKGFAPDTPEIFTEKGERVRSKSEKMIADKLLRMGIHFLCSFESLDHPLNLATVENMLRVRFGHVND